MDTLRATFLGTSTVVVTDGETTIMIDGFLTRPSLGRLLFGRIGAEEDRIFPVLDRAEANGTAAVFVAHSHFDHVLDAAAIARRTGAVVHGSPSTLTVLRAEGLPSDQAELLVNGRVREIGQMRVTSIETPHSPGRFAIGQPAPHFATPARASAYRSDLNHSFLVTRGHERILIVPSAADPGAVFSCVRADIVFLGVGGLGRRPLPEIERYWQAVVTQTGARVVVPIHWDDFTRSLDHGLRAWPLDFDGFRGLRTHLDRLAQRDGVDLRVLDAFDTIESPDHLHDSENTGCPDTL